MDAFISYQRADALYVAHALGYALRAAGHSAFVDTGSIDGGAAFPQAIDRAIATSNVLLAVIGPGFDFERLAEPANVITFEWRRAQFYGVPVVPVLVDGGRIPPDADLPAELRWFTRRNAFSLRPASFSGDVAVLVEAVPALGATPRPAARVLWIDDQPANNEAERRILRPYGIVFDTVVSTTEALEQLAMAPYDLVITDHDRVHSSDQSRSAGRSLLAHPAIREGGPPVIVYAGAYTVGRKRDALLQLGAHAVTAARQQLLDAVLDVLGRKDVL